MEKMAHRHPDLASGAMGVDHVRRVVGKLEGDDVVFEFAVEIV